LERVIAAVRDICRGRNSKAIRTHRDYFIKNQSRMAYANLMAMKLPIGSGAIESTVRRVGQLATQRGEPVLVSSECRSDLTVALLLQGGSMEPVKTYGHFTLGSAGNLTVKRGMRPSELPMERWLRRLKRLPPTERCAP
jgi:hypothetical protein